MMKATHRRQMHMRALLQLRLHRKALHYPIFGLYCLASQMPIPLFKLLSLKARCLSNQAM